MWSSLQQAVGHRLPCLAETRCGRTGEIAGEREGQGALGRLSAWVTGVGH